MLNVIESCPLGKSACSRGVVSLLGRLLGARGQGFQPRIGDPVMVRAPAFVPSTGAATNSNPDGCWPALLVDFDVPAAAACVSLQPGGVGMWVPAGSLSTITPEDPPSPQFGALGAARRLVFSSHAVASTKLV